LHGDEGDPNMVNMKDAKGFLFRVLIGDVLSLKRITNFHSPNTPSSKMPIMVVPKLVRH
jgi:hypothetical protein